MMKTSFVSAGVMLALAVTSLSQNSPQPATSDAPAQAEAPKTQISAAPANGLGPGTLLAVELSKPLDAKKSKANDRIEARTAADMLEHGRIVVPHNTKILGHVTEVKPRTKASPDSMVGITFDRVQLKDGSEVPLQVVVQAIARPLLLGPGGEGGLSTRPGMPPNLPGQRIPSGDASASSGPSSFPGDLAVPPDPMASPRPNSNATTVPLSPTSRGVVGMKDLSLDTAGSVSVLSSNTMNVHLDGGTQLILRVQ
jgi:hypothetical protein